MQLIVVTLVMSLGGCGVAYNLAAPEVGVRKQLAPLCPTPTPTSKFSKIASELEDAISKGSPPNALSTEWERLDEAARKCRGQTNARSSP